MEIPDCRSSLEMAHEVYRGAGCSSSSLMFLYLTQPQGSPRGQRGRERRRTFGRRQRRGRHHEVNTRWRPRHPTPPLQQPLKILIVGSYDARGGGEGSRQQRGARGGSPSCSGRGSQLFLSPSASLFPPPLPQSLPPGRPPWPGGHTGARIPMRQTYGWSPSPHTAYTGGF